MLRKKNRSTFYFFDMNKTVFISLVLITLRLTLYSQDLQINWQHCYGGTNADHVYDIIPIDGGYFLVGSTESINGDITFNHGSFDAWLLKIDSFGNIVWEKTFGGSDGDGCGIIIPTQNNHFYLLCASGSSDGDISYDPYPGSNDIWIVKIDNSGNIIWDKIIGGGMIDAIESATLTNDGGVAVFGWTGSQNGDVSVNYGYYDMWLVKLNSDGEIVWDKSFGTDDFDYGYSVIQTSDSGFLIGGTSTIGNYGNLTCIPHSIDAEVIILKLDLLGNIEWQNCYGGSEHDGAFELLEIGDGYMILGYADSNDGDVTGHHGESDIWIIKTDFFGNINWEHCFGGNNGEFAHNLFIQENGDFIIFGQTYSNDGDVFGNHSLSEYESDIWFVKLNSEGEFLTQQCFGGIGSEIVEFGVVKKSDNNFVIAGQTNYGPSYDVACAPHGSLGTDTDYWVFEIDSLDTTGGIENYYENEVLWVYPNPAKDYVEFNFTSPYPSRMSGTGSQGGNCSEIMITDILGQKVIKLEVKSEKTVWDCREVKDGIYFYNVEIEGKWYAGKVVVRKRN